MMRWLLIAAPILLGSGGLTILSLAPRSHPQTDPTTGDPGLSSVLSATVSCPGEIQWPAVTLPASGGAGGKGQPFSVVEGLLTGIETDPTGLTLAIAAEGESATLVNLVNPACLPAADASLRPFLESVWEAWTRPCGDCAWTERVGGRVRAVTLPALQGGSANIYPVVALTFEPCATGEPPSPTATATATAAPGGALTPAASQPPEGASAISPTAPPPSPTAPASSPSPLPSPTSSPTEAASPPASSPATSTPEDACHPTPVQETPTPGPAATTTASPSPATATAPPAAFEIEAYTAQVARGDSASVTVLGIPGTTCEVEYRTPAGTVSRAAGLGTATLGPDGRATWSWNISSRTSPGTGSIAVTCGDDTTTVPVEVI